MDCQVCGVGEAEAMCECCQEWAFSPRVRVQILKYDDNYYVRTLSMGNNQRLFVSKAYQRKRAAERLIQLLFPLRKDIEYVDGK